MEIISTLNNVCDHNETRRAGMSAYEYDQLFGLSRRSEISGRGSVVRSADPLAPTRACLNIWNSPCRAVERDDEKRCAQDDHESWVW